MYKPAFLQYNNNVNKQISWKNTYRHFRPLPNAPKFRVAARTLLKRIKLYINGNEIVTEKKVQSLLIFFFIKFWLVFQLQRWLSWRWCYNIFGRASFTGIVEPDNAVKYPALPPLTRQHGNVTVLILQEFQKFSTFIFRIAMIEFSFFTFFLGEDFKYQIKTSHFLSGFVVEISSKKYHLSLSVSFIIQ